jgi:ubiquinone/menaquinone biosynthesis C-methylase UbiE
MEVLEELYQSYSDAASHMRLPQTLDEANASVMKRDYFLQEILQFTKPQGRLLDVGCGWGAFLLNARDRGFEPAGMELTRPGVAYANEVLGIPVVNTQFIDTPFAPESAAVITMLHVLEHLPYPKQALEKVQRTLKSGGLFCGIVPNIASFCADTQGEGWQWLDATYHYVHYTPATLRKHLEAVGLKVERMYTDYGDYARQNVRKVAEGVHPELKDDHAYDLWLDKIHAEGRGEEIRFFARKPGAKS